MPSPRVFGYLSQPTRRESWSLDRPRPPFQSRKSDQSFSVASFEIPLPSGLGLAKRAAQSILRGFSGIAGERVAKVSPLRVIVICSPCSIHFARLAKLLRNSRTVAVFICDTNMYHANLGVKSGGGCMNS